jgi:integrase
MPIRKHLAKTGRVTYFVYGNDASHRWSYVGKAYTKEDARTLERREKEKQWQIRKGLAVADSKKSFEELALPWVEERLKTHSRGKDDKWRLKKHLLPVLGELRLPEITVAKVKDLLKQMRDKGAGKTTMRACVRLLGRFLTEQTDAGLIGSNPVSRLDRHTRRLFKPDHDPRETPFLRTKDDIRRVFLGFRDEAMRTIFAVGVLAGLRTGELLALRIEDINLPSRRILVQRSFDKRTKDEEPRIVPITNSLLPILEAWLAKRGRPEGLVFPPKGHGTFIRPHTLRGALQDAIGEASVQPLTWYQATRHTFASHWVTDGRPIEKLRNILGHSSVDVTERYAHLAPDLFSAADYDAVAVDFTDPVVLEMRPNRPGKKEAITTKSQQWPEGVAGKAHK